MQCFLGGKGGTWKVSLPAAPPWLNLYFFSFNGCRTLPEGRLGLCKVFLRCGHLPRSALSGLFSQPGRGIWACSLSPWLRCLFWGLSACYWMRRWWASSQVPRHMVLHPSIHPKAPLICRWISILLLKKGGDKNEGCLLLPWCWFLSPVGHFDASISHCYQPTCTAHSVYEWQVQKQGTSIMWIISS